MTWWGFGRLRRPLGSGDVSGDGVRSVLVRDVPAPGVRLGVELAMEVLGCKVAEAGRGPTVPEGDGQTTQPSGEMPMGLGLLLTPVQPSAVNAEPTGRLTLEVTYRIIVRDLRVVEDHPASVELSVWPADVQ